MTSRVEERRLRVRKVVACHDRLKHDPFGCQIQAFRESWTPLVKRQCPWLGRVVAESIGNYEAHQVYFISNRLS
jgi:hypothetical protein